MAENDALLSLLPSTSGISVVPWFRAEHADHLSSAPLASADSSSSIVATRLRAMMAVTSSRLSVLISAMFVGFASSGLGRDSSRNISSTGGHFELGRSKLTWLGCYTVLKIIPELIDRSATIGRSNLFSAQGKPLVRGAIGITIRPRGAESSVVLARI